MGRNLLFPVFAALVWLMGIAMPASASAQAGLHAPPPEPCHAYSDHAMDMTRAVTALNWNCSEDGWEDGHRYIWLRFDDASRSEQLRHFSSRITVFRSIAIAALSNGEVTGETHQSIDDALAVAAGPAFRLDLPETAEVADQYIVRIEAPHSITIASEARLTNFPEREAAAIAGTIFLALTTGMLVMPFLFDAMFYLVLRERFVLLHFGMIVGMILYILTSGGVLSAFVALPVGFVGIVGPLSWALGVGCGGLFIAQFIESDMLRHWERKLLAAMAVWAMVVPGFASLQFDFSQSFDNRLYFYAFIPVIPTYVAAIFISLWRGSRAARFLAVAWTPVVIASIDRLLKGLGTYASSDSLDLALFFALAAEVIIVGLGVADRFFAVRRERDRALTEARTLEELTERDALTGLLNRRAIESRFKTLRAEGFTTLAVIDLDQFKKVNDKYGHTAGDQVLKDVACALRNEDENTLAFRMGGEEFVLLLRGKHSLGRAEHRRQAIGDKVTGPGGEPVTASMGIVEAPLDALSDAGFETLYARADRLLYEAKASGRDCTMSERLKVFRPRSTADRRAAA